MFLERNVSLNSHKYFTGPPPILQLFTFTFEDISTSDFPNWPLAPGRTSLIYPLLSLKYSLMVSPVTEYLRNISLQFLVPNHD